MDALKKIFPYSFGAKDTGAFVIKIIVYIVATIIGSVLLGLTGAITGWIPVVGTLVGIILGAIGTLIDVYCVAGIVILVLVYLKVLK